jgi:hypothetical protein
MPRLSNGVMESVERDPVGGQDWGEVGMLAVDLGVVLGLVLSWVWCGLVWPGVVWCGLVWVLI